MVRTAWQNKRHPVNAWRVLTKGVCDGCALGVAGFHDQPLGVETPQEIRVVERGDQQSSLQRLV